MTKINGKAPIFHLKLPLAIIWEHCKKSAETILYELQAAIRLVDFNIEQIIDKDRRKTITQYLSK